MVVLAILVVLLFLFFHPALFPYIMDRFHHANTRHLLPQNKTRGSTKPINAVGIEFILAGGNMCTHNMSRMAGGNFYGVTLSHVGRTAASGFQESWP